MRAYLYLADGFEEIEAITTIDILRRGGIDIKTVSVTGKFDVEGAHDIVIISDLLFEDADYSHVNMIILPGGMPGTHNLQIHEGVTEKIKEFDAAGKWIAAICAAPKILGQLGILKGKAATCYPGLEKELIGAKYQTDPVVVAGNIITSRGAGTASDFGFKILELLKDKETADDIKAKMIF
ncbi:MAG: DJ-1/PfpI family protein [Eubacteriaceae bacterium]|nr:DJ-1/PfpI family protein [Eubacteriaceae bacterium]